MHTMAHAWVHRRPAFLSVQLLSTAALLSSRLPVPPTQRASAFQAFHSLETQGRGRAHAAAMEPALAVEPSVDGAGADPPLSRKQQKKQQRRQQAEEAFAAKKRQKKEAKKEAKRAEQASKQAAWDAMTEEEREAVRKQAEIDRAAREAAKAEAAAAAAAAGPTPVCVIDLDFDDLMDEQEVRSLVQQLMYSYGANKRAARPLRFHLTSLCGRIERQLRHIDGVERWQVTRSRESYLDAFPREQLVYLSSDSSELLTDLEPDTAYVIGGLVDHNRHKGLTQARAERAGVRTARLPIDEHMQMSQRRVLAVNHVFEILLHHTQHGDWSAAFAQAMPQRRGATLKEAGGQPSDTSSAPAAAAEGAAAPAASGSAAEVTAPGDEHEEQDAAAAAAET